MKKRGYDFQVCKSDYTTVAHGLFPLQGGGEESKVLKQDRNLGFPGLGSSSREVLKSISYVHVWADAAGA